MTTKKDVLIAFLNKVFVSSYDQRIEGYSNIYSTIELVPNPNPTGDYIKGLLMDAISVIKGVGYKEFEHELYIQANNDNIIDEFIDELENYSLDSQGVINVLITGLSDIEFEYTDLTALLNQYMCSYNFSTLTEDYGGYLTGDLMQQIKQADNSYNIYVNGIFITSETADMTTKLDCYNGYVDLPSSSMLLKGVSMFSLPLGTDYAYIDKITMLLNFEDESVYEDLPYNKLFNVYVFYSETQLDFRTNPLDAATYYSQFIALTPTVKGLSFTTEESEQTISLDLTPTNQYLNIMIIPVESENSNNFRINFGADYESTITLEHIDLDNKLVPYYVEILEKERSVPLKKAIIKILARYER
jgi:hypothetical protein